MRVPQTLVLLGALARLGFAQDCPILGPAYPEPDDYASSQVIQAAKTAFDTELNQAIASGKIANGTSFSIQVFSAKSDKPLFERYHTAAGEKQVGAETVYRIASISKLFTIYTILAAVGEKYWNDPITRWVPELARAPRGDVVDHPVWSEITLGALASHLGGVQRDFASTDLSATVPGGSIPGLPALNESERVTCGAVGMKPCTRKEALARIIKSHPISPSFHTPAYSNMAFQLLGYAAEAITHKKFPDLVRGKILKPLKLSRTFLSLPANDTDIAVSDLLDYDLGDGAPGGGYFSTASDLTTLGRSILKSTLLPPLTTRAWLKPATHTSNLILSIGRPWEIARLPVPVSSSNSDSASTTATRIVDVYAKTGSIGGYQSVVGISPDHGIGISVLIAGPKALSGQTYAFLEDRMVKVWVTAAEHAARERAGAAFVGKYSFAGDGSTAEFSLRPGEPGLFVDKVVSNGTDVLSAVGAMFGVPEGAQFGFWLYPMRLVGKGRMAFRASFGVVGAPLPERCDTWGSLDVASYGGNPIDLVVFEVGKDGKATAVEFPVLKKILKRE